MLIFFHFHQFSSV